MYNLKNNKQNVFADLLIKKTTTTSKSKADFKQESHECRDTNF